MAKTTCQGCKQLYEKSEPFPMDLCPPCFKEVYKGKGKLDGLSPKFLMALGASIKPVQKDLE